MIRSNSDSNFFENKYFLDSLRKNVEHLDDFTGERKSLRRKFSKKVSKIINFNGDDHKIKYLKQNFNMQLFLVRVRNLIKMSNIYFYEKVMKNLKANVKYNFKL